MSVTAASAFSSSGKHANLPVRACHSFGLKQIIPQILGQDSLNVFFKIQKKNIFFLLTYCSTLKIWFNGNMAYSGQGLVLAPSEAWVAIGLLAPRVVFKFI